MQLIAFYVLSTLVLLSAICVIGARNPVHSVLWLIFTFFTSAGLFILIGAEFLAMLLVVVYVGAVAVLFLFVVMMLNVDFEELKRGFLEYLPIGAVMALALFGEFLLISFGLEGSASFDPAPGAATNTEAIAAVLYDDYFLLFQIAGLILLVAMIAAIILTLRHRDYVQRQDMAVQATRKPEDTVTLVDVETGEGV